MNKNKLPKSRIKLIKRISTDIEDCEIEDRRHILNMIAEKTGIEDVLYPEGTGVRVKFVDLDDELLKNIDNFIVKAKEKTKLNLDSDSEDDQIKKNNDSPE